MQVRRLDENEVAEALAGWLAKQPGIQAAYTRRELVDGKSSSDPMVGMVRRCFHAERCGDLFVVLKPNYLVTTSYLTGTTHGTPHAYDTHVPLLFSGPGIAAGIRRDDLVAPGCCAAVMAKLLGIPPPEKMQYSTPAGVLADR